MPTPGSTPRLLHSSTAPVIARRIARARSGLWRLGFALVGAVALVGLGSSDAAAAIAFVKNVGTASSTTAGTTTTITLGAGATAAGNSIVVSITLDASAGAVSVADSSGN